jgi:hypothetical protein
MTTNPTRPGSRPEVCEPAAGEPPAPASGVKLSKSIGPEQLEALRFELDEGNNHWPDHVAAMIDEDYRQLMKDFGLR